MSFKLSPVTSDPGVTHETAHDIKDFRDEVDISPVGISRARKNRTSGRFTFDPARYGATKLGAGAYGVAYRVTINASLVEFLISMLAHGDNRVLNRPPRVGTEVVVKVTRRPKGDSQDAFVRASLRESALHKQLLGAGSCSKICGRSCPSDVIPPFYFSAMASDGTYVTVMGLVKGGSLSKYMRSVRMTPKFYVALEKAAASMWTAGVVHADFHDENVMVDPHTGKITVIDFGFGVVLPPALRAKVESRIRDLIRDGTRSLASVWDRTDLGGYVNRVQAKRLGGGWYNPDNRVLLASYNKLSAEDRARVPDLRRKAWKCGTGKTRARTGKTMARTGKTPTGKTRVPTGKTRVPTGKTRVPTGKTRVRTGKTRVRTGKTRVRAMAQQPR